MPSLMLLAVNYHYVRPVFDHPYPGIQGVTPTEFEAQLNILGGLGTFVSGREVLGALRGESLPHRAILVTFDDGLREQYEWAWPILKRMGIPALFFVNTAPIAESRVLSVHKLHLLRSHVAPEELMTLLRSAAAQRDIDLSAELDARKVAAQCLYDPPETARLKYLLTFGLSPPQREWLVSHCFDTVFAGSETRISRELYLDPNQVRTLAAQGCIGSHSHEHLPLALLSDVDADAQIGRATHHLEQWTGQRPYAMSYPYGPFEACSPAVGAIARHWGIHFAFTMERAVNQDLSQPMLLARFDCTDVPGGKGCRLAPEEFFACAPAAAWYRS